MFKVLQVRIQEQGSYRFRNSKYARLADREDGSIDRDAILQNFNFSPIAQIDMAKWVRIF